ncbi:uncharacterized protein PFL1_04524 [Pseudozyma flocculosa PF-1]|uniref:Uncharacterized protein n=1 Tax=Pseudozyma flocculosa PF-1 TaxID=1277687 RepID=A0A061H5P5_9BASI|nr:uncharacterized protein PFL1_04524 [Pseudozyma flocculosa PF-1]EPQ27779.1 hypothetical protein PFL1_04524 [Pseudozyma flocculosa PF-1]
MAPSPPPPGLAPSRRVGRRRLPLSAKRSDELTALLLPAIKAFGLGYLMDILPAIIKALLRFTTSELKRIRAQQKRTNEERSLATDWATRRPSLPTRAIDAFHLVAPSLARLPLLLQAILKALVAALGPQGMALSCFCAMAGWKISESMLWWPITKYYALKLSHSAPDVRRQLALTRARVAATFISASVSSALSLMVLQHNSIQADLRAATAAAAAAASGGIAATASGNATKPTTLPPVPTGSDSLHIDTTSSWIPKPLRSPRFGFTAPRAPASVTSCPG